MGRLAAISGRLWTALGVSSGSLGPSRPWAPANGPGRTDGQTLAHAPRRGPCWNGSAAPWRRSFKKRPGENTSTAMRT
eukprot:8297269-Pyramimonas_sp.AAC.1